MGTSTPTTPQSETRTQEPASAPTVSGRKAGMGRPSRRLASPPLPPASQRSGPWGPLSRTDSRPPPTPAEVVTKSSLLCLALRPSRPRAHSHPILERGRRSGCSPQRAGARTQTSSERQAKRPWAPRPSQQRRAHLHGLPHRPRQRGHQCLAAAPPQARLFLPWLRRGAESRLDSRKTAQHRSLRGPRLPHPPLPAAAAAPSGVSAAAPGVLGVAGGRGRAGLRGEPAPPLGRGCGVLTQVRSPRPTLTSKFVSGKGTAYLQSTFRLWAHFLFTRVLPLFCCHTATTGRS